MVHRVARDLRRFVIAMLVSHLPSSPPRAASQGKPALDYCAGGERLLADRQSFARASSSLPWKPSVLPALGLAKAAARRPRPAGCRTPYRSRLDVILRLRVRLVRVREPFPFL